MIAQAPEFESILPDHLPKATPKPETPKRKKIGAKNIKYLHPEFTVRPACRPAT
ncbi:hypothetical protein K440DRAFT_626348 [Wilcoxina mikolae CBS 423.85]|nr:hypothetical protein K440DRAFT_626348 [Wilcoxina mikolae CBS 423.85]